MLIAYRKLLKTLLKIILGILLFLNTSHVFSQIYNGRIIGPDKEPMDNCTVSVVRLDSIVVRTVLTNKNGDFRLSERDAEISLLRIALPGYQTLIKEFPIGSFNFGTITLRQQNTTLNEVLIVSTKPLYDQQIDKLVVNVRNSILAESSNVAEILESAPGITLSEGQLSLKGKSHVNVMIDGKPANLSSADLALKLQALSGRLVEKIEIIENPSAKYDAEGTGGIINIITRKGNKAGFNMGLNTGITIGVFNKSPNSLNFNYGVGAMNVYGDYSLFYQKSLTRTHIEREDLIKGFNTFGDRTSISKNQTFTFGSDYSINSKNAIGFLLRGFMESRNQESFANTSINSTDGVLDSSSVLTRDIGRDWRNLNVNLFYKLLFKKQGSELNINVDRSRFGGEIQGNILTEFQYYSAQTRSPFVSYNQMPSDLEIGSLKIDYNHPVSKNSSLETGLKYSNVNTDNDARFRVMQNKKWVTDKGKTNHFLYRETIYAGYLNYKLTINKSSLQMGIRAEETMSNGNSLTLSENVTRNYFKLFPTFFFSTELNKNNKLNFGYSERVGRPNYNQLNPFTYFVDNYNYFYGNPYLNPSYTQSLSLNHTYKSVLNTSLNYTNTKDYISYAYFMEKQPDSSDVWIETIDNLNSYKSFSLSFSSPLKIIKGWTSNNNFLIFYNDSKVKYKNVDFQNDMVAWKFNTVHSISLINDIKMEISGSYQSKMVNGFWTVFDRSAVNAGIKKQFFNNKASASIAITDIFNNTDLESTMIYNSTNVRDYTKNETRLLKINLTYQINSGEVKARKQRATGAEDEQKRVGF